jgi:tetratricopeptide (TPR) repeat protein
MEESNNYYDFVKRLCNMVLENEVPVNLVYIAAVNAWWCRIEETKNLIQKKYRDVLCIRPWAYAHNSVERDQVRFHDAVVEAIDKVIDSSAEDWMETELHLLHTFYHWPSGEVTSLLEPVEKAKMLINENPLLNCFEPLIHAFEGMAKAKEGFQVESIASVQRGRELAEKHDDALFIYMNLLEHALFLNNVSVQESLARFEELYDLALDLEVPYFTAEVLNDSAIVFEAAGEYDLAISSHYEKLKLLNGAIPEPTPSRVYSTLGDGQRALEVMNRYFEYAEPVVTPIHHLWRAWALALVDRLEEAEQILDNAYSMIIKSGSERILGNYYHFSGVVELRKGDFLAALDLIEKAWDIAERIPAGTDQNRALLDLARAEILLSNQSRDSTKIVAPGKWLCKLETYAEEKELPGIRMQAALLKSEFYEMHGQLKDAQAVLRDALDITDSLGVATLRKRISNRIDELNRLLREAEISPKSKEE